MYRMDAVKVDTLLSGEIDCADLERKLRERKDKPAILNVNIGEGLSLYHIFGLWSPVMYASIDQEHYLCSLVLVLK